MKKLLFILCFIPLLSKAQLAGRLDFKTFSWDIYGAFTDSTLTELRDSIGSTVYLDSYYAIHTGRFRVTRTDRSHNDGRPTTLVWADDSGYVKRSPTDSLFIRQAQVTGLVDSLANRYIKSQIDAFLAGKLNLADTANMLTVYARKIEYYTKTNMQTSGQSQVHWDNLTNKPTIGTVSSVGLSSTDFSVSGSPVTTTGTITANLNTSGVSAGTYEYTTVNAKGIVTSAYNSVNNTLSARTFGTAYQASNTSRIYDVDFTVSISIGSGILSTSNGQITLDVSPNGSTGWVEYGRSQNANTGVLAAQNTQVVQVFAKDIPAGYYYRLNSTINSGAATFSNALGGHEILKR